ATGSTPLACVNVATCTVAGLLPTASAVNTALAPLMAGSFTVSVPLVAAVLPKTNSLTCVPQICVRVVNAGLPGITMSSALQKGLGLFGSTLIALKSPQRLRPLAVML